MVISIAYSIGNKEDKIQGEGGLPSSLVKYSPQSGFGRTEPFNYLNIRLLPAAAFKYFR